MKIAKDTVVSVAYKLSDAQGNLIEESEEPMVYLHGGYDGTFPKIEEALDGQEAGYQTQIQLEPRGRFRRVRSRTREGRGAQPLSRTAGSRHAV